MRVLTRDIHALQRMLKYNRVHSLRTGEFESEAQSGGGAAGMTPAKVEADAAVRKQLTTFFGKELSDSEIAGLAGAPSGTIVRAKLTGLEESVRLKVVGKEMHATRTIEKFSSESPIVIKNEYLEVSESQQGHGIGTQMLVTEADQASALGVSKITTEAAFGTGFNGYYTWARLGYNAPFPPSYVRSPNWASGVKTMTDMMALPATADHQSGASWWKANGKTWEGTFDLKPGSQSFQILHAYADARGIAHKGKGGMPSKKSDIGKGEEIPWNDEDEAIAERVWQTLAKQWVNGTNFSADAQPPLDIQKENETRKKTLFYNHAHSTVNGEKK